MSLHHRVAEPGPKQPVISKLLPSLTPLVGRLGFCSLLERALTLAKRENSDLVDVRVTPDCLLENLPSEPADAIGTLTTHLIGLLGMFMGDTLTLRLLRNSWPELPALQEGRVEQSEHD
jgi:hypothetical protein